MQRHRAHVTRDSHFVVVQDDDERRLFLPDIVQGLERHAASKRGIADERNDLLLLPRKIARPRKPAGDRKRVGCMPGRVNIMRIGVRFRKT